MSTSLAKKEVMEGRKPRTVNVEEIVYETKTQAVYLLIKKYTNLVRADLVNALVHDDSDVTEKDIDNALTRFKANGYVTVTADTNTGAARYHINPDVVYTPRKPVKVAPNDKKGYKAKMKKLNKAKIEGQVPLAASHVAEIPVQPEVNGAVNEPKPQVPVQTQDANLKVERKTKRKPAELQFVQGLAAVDADHPAFAETAQELAKKVGQPIGGQEDAKEIPRAKVYMFFEVGDQTLVLDPAQAKQLYSDLDILFGSKK